MYKNQLISIIINCHNGQKYLHYCLKSIFEQTYKKWEIIFFNNCSSDHSKKIIKSYKSSKIKYFESKKILTLYKARNEAVKKAKGSFVTFLDVDDYWKKDKLKKQIDFFINNKEYDVVYSNYYVLSQKKKKFFIKHKKKLPSGLIYSNLLKDYMVGLLTVCFRKKIFENFSFNDKYNIIGDYDFIMQIAKKRSKIGSIQKALSVYRIHNNNLSKKNLSLYILELENWIKRNNEKLKKEKNLKYLKFYLFKLKVKFLFNKILGF